MMMEAPEIANKREEINKKVLAAASERLALRLAKLEEKKKRKRKGLIKPTELQADIDKSLKEKSEISEIVLEKKPQISEEENQEIIGDFASAEEVAVESEVAGNTETALEEAINETTADVKEEVPEQQTEEAEAPEVIEAEYEVISENVVAELDEAISQKEAERNERRAKYAEQEYRTYNAISKIKNILGIKYDSGKVDSVSAHYKDYKDVSNELLNLKLEQIKKKGLSSVELRREMGNLIKEFDFDEKMNIFAAHTDARSKIFEEKFGKAPGWIAKKSSEFINWYRKIDWKKKMVVGITAGAAGLGMAMAINRAIGSVATGVGVTGMLEAKQRKKEMEEAEERKEEIINEAEEKENKFNFIREKLKEINLGEDLKLEKKKALYRKLLGAGTAAAVFFGSRALSGFTKEHWGDIKAGGKEFLSKIGFDMYGDSGHSISGVVNKELYWQQGGEGVDASSIHKPAAEIAKTIDLDRFEKGGNIEASIRDYLRANPDIVDKYNESPLSGGNKFNVGEIAHRMFLEHGDQSSVVQAGGQVHLSADGLHIESIDHSGISGVAEVSDLGAEGGPEKPFGENLPEVGAGDAGNHSLEAVTQPAPESSLDNFGGQAEEFAAQYQKDLNAYFPAAMDGQEILGHYPEYKGSLENFPNYLKKSLAALDHDIISAHENMMARLDTNLDGDLSDAEIAADPFSQQRMEALTERKILLEANLEKAEIIREKFQSAGLRISDTVKSLFEGTEVKNFNSDGHNFSAKEFLDSHQEGKLWKVYKGAEGVLGKDAVSPKNGETLKAWTHRFLRELTKLKK